MLSDITVNGFPGGYECLDAGEEAGEEAGGEKGCYRSSVSRSVSWFVVGD